MKDCTINPPCDSKRMIFTLVFRIINTISNRSIWRRITSDYIPIGCFYSYPIRRIAIASAKIDDIRQNEYRLFTF